MQITGLCDRSGSFGVNLHPQRSSSGWDARITFEVLVPLSYLSVLQDLQSFFGVGKIYTTGRAATYRVTRIADVLVLLNHFNSYPPIKNTDFLLWAEAVQIKASGQHKTEQGFNRLLSALLQVEVRIRRSETFRILLRQKYQRLLYLQFLIRDEFQDTCQFTVLSTLLLCNPHERVQVTLSESMGLV